MDGKSIYSTRIRCSPCTRVRAHPSMVNSVAFSSDGTRIVSGGDDNTVKVWDAKS